MILIENCNGCEHSRIGDSISEMTCVKLSMYDNRVDRFSIHKDCPLEDVPNYILELMGKGRGISDRPK